MAVQFYVGDCRRVLPAIPETYGCAKPFKFAFVDPPFNIGEKYGGYDDTLSEVEYATLLEEVLLALASAVGGVVALHGPDKCAEIFLRTIHVLQHGDGLLRAWHRIAWVNWYYGFGQCTRSNWVDARCHCLIYATWPRWTWNPDDVLRPSARASTYRDRRTLLSETPGERLPGTVWGVPDDGQFWGRVQGNNRERCPERPNQLPEVYLERLIRAYTNPGDNVLDPFCGTGTTAVVADALGRNCTTIDIDPAAIEVAKARLQRGAVRISLERQD